jgi:Putative peptidoglycan binding domain
VVKLDDVVGNDRTNRPGDVAMVKQAFAQLGRYVPPKDGPHGIIDRALDEAIRDYQEDRELRVDGWMRPDGETARLRYDLALMDDREEIV